MSSLARLRNYVEPVPGSTVTAYLGTWEHLPTTWVYSLWTGRNGEEGDTELISTGWLEMPENATPNQVARVAFLLDVDYADRDLEWEQENALYNRYDRIGQPRPLSEQTPQEVAQEDRDYWTDKYDHDPEDSNDDE